MRSAVTIAIIAAAVIVAAFSMHRWTGGNAPQMIEARLSDTMHTLDISADGKLVIRLEAKNTSPFDTDDNGNPSVPATDYLFEEGTGLVDQKHKRVFFVVRNAAAAGNVNASKALFVYSVAGQSIVRIASREFTNGLRTLSLSPTGRFLVFDDGSHSGLCSSVVGLAVLDLQKEYALAAEVYLPYGGVGAITFDDWLDDSHFRYTEHTFASIDACEKDVASEHSVKKTFALEN